MYRSPGQVSGAGLRGVETVEPQFRLEPLEDLARLGQERLCSVAPTLRYEPFALLEQRDSEVER